MPGAGGLNQIIVIEAPTVAGDGYGGGELSWAAHTRAWASVKPVSAREGERQGAERASSMYMIEVYQDGLAGITEAMRIRWLVTAWNDMVLNIREIRRPAKASLTMTIMAETGVTQ